MAKKFSLLLAAIAVVAFAVPAFASAAPEVTVGGARAPLGTEINGTSNNTITKTSIGNLTCATVEISGEITANTGSTVAGVASGPASTATCFYKGTTPITIDDPTLLSLHSGTAGSGTVGLTFEATLPSLTCHYSGTAVPFTYSSGGNSLNLKGALKASPAGCGTATIEGTYTVTSPSGAVVLH